MRAVTMVGRIAVLVVAVLVNFSSLVSASDLTEKQREAILKAHPSCGNLIIFASMVGAHPDLLDMNLKFADKLGGTLGSGEENKDVLSQGFRHIALFANHHPEMTQRAIQKYWTVVCEKMEQCKTDNDARSDACKYFNEAFQ